MVLLHGDIAGNGMDDYHLCSLDLVGLTSEINYDCNVVTLGSNGTHQAGITSDHMSTRLP